MDRGKHEPTDFDEYFRWHERNCEKCLRYKPDPDQAYMVLNGSCKWNEDYTDYAFGYERPNDEIITSMFDKPLCSGLERSDLKDKLSGEGEEE